MDEEGVLPEAIEAAHRASSLKVVYVQSTINNPSGTTMGLQRRQQIAALLERENLVAVEDTVCSFLHELPPIPLVALAPSHAILVDSMSKRASPGLTIGMILVPSATLRQQVATALRSGAAPFALEAEMRWIHEGVLRTLEQQERQDATIRQAIIRARLGGQKLRGDRCTYHLWLDLPEPWRADSFVAATARSGAAVTPTSVPENS
jgi:DNA-binding transcriptional MocR family regulator